MKYSLFVICVETIIYLLFYNLHDCTFKFKCFPSHIIYTSLFCISKKGVFVILIESFLLLVPADIPAT